MQPRPKTTDLTRTTMERDPLDGRLAWITRRETWSLAPNGDLVALLSTVFVSAEPVEALELAPYWIPRARRTWRAA